MNSRGYFFNSLHFPFFFLACVVGLIPAAGWRTAAQESVDITAIARGAARPIPIALSGFSGETAAVLRFDLEVAGFAIVPEESAQYKAGGSSSGSLEGYLIDQVTKKRLFANRYEGGTARAQAHKFADDIVERITQKPGIAQLRIAFRGESGGNTEIYIADYDGANPFAVTRDRTLVSAPAWDASRRMLYYMSYRSGYPDIYAHDLNSGARRIVAQYPGLNASPAVSPDGTKLAMILSKNGSPDLYVCNADGSNLKQLTKTRQDESSPCWSPDGRKICFVSSVGGTPALYVIPAEGGKMERIRTAGAGVVTEPDWSPDGEWIAFTVLRRQFEICRVPASGGESVTLAVGEDPVWAPNSRTILFTRRERGRRVLSLLDVPTKRVKDVALNLSSCSQPCWSR